MGYKLRRIIRHLFEIRPFFITFAVLIGAWLIAYFTAYNLSEQIRHSGTLLQVSGFILVAKGIANLRCLFGRPKIKTKVTEWLRYIPKYMNKPESIILNAKLGKFGMTGYAISRGYSFGNDGFILDSSWCQLYKYT